MPIKNPPQHQAGVSRESILRNYVPHIGPAPKAPWPLLPGCRTWSPGSLLMLRKNNTRTRSDLQGRATRGIDSDTQSKSHIVLRYALAVYL